MFAILQDGRRVEYRPDVPLDMGGAAIDTADAEANRACYCWPIGLVLRPGLGVLVPRYPDQFFFISGPEHVRGKAKTGLRFFGRKNRQMLAPLVEVPASDVCRQPQSGPKILKMAPILIHGSIRVRWMSSATWLLSHNIVWYFLTNLPRASIRLSSTPCVLTQPAL